MKKKRVFEIKQRKIAANVFLAKWIERLFSLGVGSNDTIFENRYLGTKCVNTGITADLVEQRMLFTTKIYNKEIMPI